MLSWHHSTHSPSLCLPGHSRYMPDRKGRSQMTTYAHKLESNNQTDNTPNIPEWRSKKSWKAWIRQHIGLYTDNRSQLRPQWDRRREIVRRRSRGHFSNVSNASWAVERAIVRCHQRISLSHCTVLSVVYQFIMVCLLCVSIPLLESHSSVYSWWNQSGVAQLALYDTQCNWWTATLRLW